MSRNKTALEQLNKKTTIEQTNKIAYLFLLPWLIGFFGFTLFPFLYTMYLSFFNVYQGGTGTVLNWIGLDNYVQALIRNGNFTNNIITFVTNEITFTPTILVLSFIIALLLNQIVKGKSFFRVIFFLPVVIISGPVMEKIIGNGVWSINYGDNMIFRIIFEYSPWFAEQLARLFDNFLFVIWFTGIPIILFINGLQKINHQLYEAAKIDGANSWQLLWKITIPIIKPTALIIVIYTIVNIGTFNMINPALSQITSLIGSVSGLGLSSAMAVIYTFVIIFIIGLAFLLLGREKKSKVIKFTSIQQKNLEAVYKKRLNQEKVVQK